MRILEVDHIAKSYPDKKAVDDLSFHVDSGEVFGLIGPNGAGKSSTIRMIMDILQPDAGSIRIMGDSLGDSGKNRMGYLPEERGLYRKLTAMETIVYLASLKGVDAHTAKARANELLGRIGMLDQRDRKIEEMSKGMGQMIQFIVTIAHDPDLVMLDEPFSGLDPANAELLRTLIGELKGRGKAVVLSTHRMNEVEQLCDRILMIDRGRDVLYGSLKDIKVQFRGNSVMLDAEGDIADIPGVKESIRRRDVVELVPEESVTPQQILESLIGRGVRVNRFEVATPSLNEIFLAIVGEKHE